MPQHQPDASKQTIKQAKAAYKKNGPRTSEKERKQLERAAELDRRAERIKEQERRRKDALKKRREKDEKEKHARKSLGMGIATQMAGFNHTQKRLKGAMEAFLGFGKKTDTREECDTDNEGDAGEKALGSSDESSDNEVLTETGAEAVASQESVHVVENPLDSKDQSQSPISKLHSSAASFASERQSSIDPWDDEVLDDETLLDAIKDKTPTSQAHSLKPPAEAQVQSPCETRAPSAERKQESVDRKRSSSVQIALDDCWDDFLASNTQLERELDSPPQTKTQSSLCPSEPPETPTPAPRPKFAKPVPLITSGLGNLSRTEASKLMPPPPKRICVTPVKKQASPSSRPSSFATFGLSTQLLHDAVDDDVKLTP